MDGGQAIDLWFAQIHAKLVSRWTVDYQRAASASNDPDVSAICAADEAGGNVGRYLRRGGVVAAVRSSEDAAALDRSIRSSPPDLSRAVLTF